LKPCKSIGYIANPAIKGGFLQTLLQRLCKSRRW